MVRIRRIITSCLNSFSSVTSSTGEALQNCTESEWDASDEPYSAELLNVKKKPVSFRKIDLHNIKLFRKTFFQNRVNVFSATEKNMETVIVTEVSPPQTPLQPSNF